MDEFTDQVWIQPEHFRPDKITGPYKVGDLLAVWRGAGEELEIAEVLAVVPRSARVAGSAVCKVRLPDGRERWITPVQIRGVQGRQAALDAAPTEEEQPMPAKWDSLYAPAHSGNGATATADPPAPDAAPGFVPAFPLAWVEDNPDDLRGDKESGLDELAESIMNQGVLDPVHVYKIGERRFRLINGHRRTAAARQAGLTTIPALLYPPPPDATAALVQGLLGNLLRRDLTPLEEARGYQALVDQGWSQARIGGAVGKSQTAISRALALLKEPEPIQVLIAEGRLTPKHLEVLGTITEPEVDWNGKEVRDVPTVRIAYAERAADGLSVEGLRRDVGYYQDGNAQRRKYLEQSEARRAAAQPNRRRTPEEIAKAEADEAEYQRKEKARQEMDERKRDQQRARARVARLTIADTLGQRPGAPPTLEAWRLLAMRLLEDARAHVDNSHVHHKAIDEAASPDDIFRVLGTIAPYIVELVDENRAVGTVYSGVGKWADKRHGLNQRIAKALLGEKLITEIGYKKLVKDAPPIPAPPAPPHDADPAPDPAVAYEEAAIAAMEGVPDVCPDCDIDLEWDDTGTSAGPVLICPECGTAYAQMDAAGKMVALGQDDPNGDGSDYEDEEAGDADLPKF